VRSKCVYEGSGIYQKDIAVCPNDLKKKIPRTTLSGYNEKSYSFGVVSEEDGMGDSVIICN